MRAVGGVLSEEDFGNYSIVLQQPAEIIYQGKVFIFMHISGVGGQLRRTHPVTCCSQRLNYTRSVHPFFFHFLLFFCYFFIFLLWLLMFMCRTPCDGSTGPPSRGSFDHSPEYPGRLQHHQPHTQEQHPPLDCWGTAVTVSNDNVLFKINIYLIYFFITVWHGQSLNNVIFLSPVSEDLFSSG